MLTLTQTRNAIETALAVDGGFTFDPRTGEFLRPGQSGLYGYAIAVPETEVTDAETGLPELIERAAVHSYVAGRDAFIGGWLHDGKLYLELSEIHTDKNRAEAIRLAKYRNQLAILDLATGEEISTSDKESELA